MPIFGCRSQKRSLGALAVVVALDPDTECPPNISWPPEPAAELVVGHGVASAAPNIPYGVCFGVSSLAVAVLALKVALDLKESAERVLEGEPTYFGRERVQYPPAH